MLQPEITRKCAVAVVTAIVLAGGAMGVSHWLAMSEKTAVAEVSVSKDRAAGTELERSATVRRDVGFPTVTLTEKAATASVAAASDRTQWEERSRLEREADRLKKENARLRGRLDDMVNWILENVRGTFPLPDEQMAHLRVPPVDEDMAVTDDLAKILRLSDEETDRLDAAFMGTRSLLREMELARLAVTNPADNQVVLNVPAYPDDGGQVREALYDELEQALGAARFDRFLEISGSGLAERFDYFGEADRTIQFEAFQDETSGEEQLFVRDERILPDTENALAQNIIATERIVDALPAEYYFYLGVLPEPVARFAARSE